MLATPTAGEVTWKLSRAVKLRLYHHPDGARIAYREAGTGPPLALLHSQGLTHREFEPVVDELAHRHRVVLPDLPLHGDCEDPRTTPTRRSGWPRCSPASCRHLRAAPAGRPATASAPSSRCVRSRHGALQPAELVLLPNPMHTRPTRGGLERTGEVAVRAAVVPGRPRPRPRRAGSSCAPAAATA